MHYNRIDIVYNIEILKEYPKLNNIINYHQGDYEYYDMSTEYLKMIMCKCFDYLRNDTEDILYDIVINYPDLICYIPREIITQELELFIKLTI